MTVCARKMKSGAKLTRLPVCYFSNRALPFCPSPSLWGEGKNSAISYICIKETEGRISDRFGSDEVRFNRPSKRASNVLDFRDVNFILVWDPLKPN